MLTRRHSIERIPPPRVVTANHNLPKFTQLFSGPYPICFLKIDP